MKVIVRETTFAPSVTFATAMYPVLVPKPGFMWIVPLKTVTSDVIHAVRSLPKSRPTRVVSATPYSFTRVLDSQQDTMVPM